MLVNRKEKRRDMKNQIFNSYSKIDINDKIDVMDIDYNNRVFHRIFPQKNQENSPQRKAHRKMLSH